MRKKARAFVYLNTKNYISYEFLTNFYWLVIIVPFFISIIGLYLINVHGVNWKSLFPIVSIAIWTVLYWILVLTIKNKHVKKSFELRFLVNGLVGVAISSLIWIFGVSWNLMADQPFLNFKFWLWMIPIYIIVSIFYIGFIVSGVHNGVYSKIKGKTLAFLSTSLSLAVAFGMIISRLLRESVSLKVQHIVITICFVALIFVPILTHINFVQYYYCKKYNILCDEYGNTTSPDLEPQIKVKQIKAKKETSEKTDKPDNRPPKKKIPLIIKILIGIVSAPIIFYIIVFIVLFVKTIIQRIF